MNCLPCFGSKESEINEQEDRSPVAQAKGNPSSQPPVMTMESPSRRPTIQPNNQNQESIATETKEVAGSSSRNFGFRELAMATKNFRRETLLGESRLGKVYKGTLQGTGQVVAVKQLDRHGTKANKEFLAEVMMLSVLRHPNLVELIGYCADGDQRILVYEYMEMGSVKNHLHEVPPGREPLNWITRMKIASGAAQALEYLHEEANPPILYRNFTSTNILLDENLEPKLTDYGIVRLEVDVGNTMQQRIVCTVGCAPEYEQTGDLSKKSDVYSFGVVLLELITGRKTLDTTRPLDEQNLIIWAQPYFKEPKRFPEMADPQLKGSFPAKSLNQAVGVAAMCVQDDPSVRPMISDVVAALSFLTLPQPPQPQTEPATTASTTDHDPHMDNNPSSEEEEDLEITSSSQSEDFSCSDDSEDEDEQPRMRIKNNNIGGTYDHGDKCGTSSSSESLYNEDDYWELDENHQQEETSTYRSKSKPKSIKRKVTFGTDKRAVSRNSSKASKKHSGSSFRKKSVSRRKSSKNSQNVDPSSSRRYESNSNMQSSLRLNKDESNEDSSSDSGETRRKKDSSDVEILDGGEGMINARLLEDTYVPI
ncbi:hypothetical protein SSX86_011430 [Deinandra increscens subsp. villosa]|uniref:Protein kinase domain-containing protein n=1 Tax=Deinandra increscens subsp. villosa TaxID=3103831 RepID=A0AAP0H1Z9_9ASTR